MRSRRLQLLGLERPRRLFGERFRPHHFGLASVAPSSPLSPCGSPFRPDTHGRYRYTLRQDDDVTTGEVDNRHGRGALGFMFDSVRHLFEVPWSASVIPFQRGLEARADGCEGIFLTWGADAKPTPSYDQVAVWSRNGRVVSMDTTGRDVAPFIIARVDFEGEISLGELRLPRSATVVDPKGKVVHRWELVSVRRTGRR